MDSMDNVRERIAASERQPAPLPQPLPTVARWRPWGLGTVGGVFLVSLVMLAIGGPCSQAADLACTAGDVACFADAGGQYLAATREQDSNRFFEIVVDFDRTNRVCLCFDHGAHPVFDFHVVGRRIDSAGMVSEASATLKLRGPSR